MRRELVPVRCDIDAQPAGCHAPLHAGHPVITPRQVEAKASQTGRPEVTGSSAYADDDDREYGWLKLFRVAAGVLLVAALSGTTALAQGPAKVKIRLDWKAGAQHAPFYLGKQRGYYKDEGLDLDIISGTGSSDTIKQVGSKAVEFGLIDALVLVQGAQQRVPA